MKSKTDRITVHLDDRVRVLTHDDGTVSISFMSIVSDFDHKAFNTMLIEQANLKASQADDVLMNVIRMNRLNALEVHIL